MKQKKHPPLSGTPRRKLLEPARDRFYRKLRSPDLFRLTGLTVCLWASFLIGPGISAAPLYSPTWGFRLDPPVGYSFTGGDGKDRFSFRSSEGASLDLAVYPSAASVKNLAEDIQKRLVNRGEISFFEYRKKPAALAELQFDDPGRGGMVNEGWALFLELDPPETGAKGMGGLGTGKPLLLALAYGPRGREELQNLHLSALDSLVPTEGDRRAPGPITEYAYPRGAVREVKLPDFDIKTRIHEGDPEAAQALVDREFEVLRLGAETALWQEGWIRFYRAIYRDSFERLAETAFVLERFWNTREGKNGQERDFAEWLLSWIQSFHYERERMGSDFVNLVSAVVEGRGDCDSRALLWAVFLEQANIPAAIMVSRDYGHAMGLADLSGSGARFDLGGKRWLVAETTAAVPLGLIGAGVSEISKWLGVTFED